VERNFSLNHNDSLVKCSSIKNPFRLH